MRDHAVATATRHWFTASARKIRSVKRKTHATVHNTFNIQRHLGNRSRGLIHRATLPSEPLPPSRCRARVPLSLGL
jgi:hypothetical protein